MVRLHTPNLCNYLLIRVNLEPINSEMGVIEAI